MDSKRHLVVTGVGFRSSSTNKVEDVFSSPLIRPNMGAAVAKRAATAGFSVTIAARTKSKLEAVKESILREAPSATVFIAPTDILRPSSIGELVAGLPAGKEVDLVQCAGLSSGTYKIPHDNPYLCIEDIPPELPTMEFDTIVRGLLNFLHALLPRWRAQKETRLVVVNSMSGIRAYPRGYAHASAKAGLHNAVRSICLELAKDNIYVSEVNPGAVNTGFYDPDAVVRAVEAIALEFGYDYRDTSIPQISPSSVAEAVFLCLTSDAHILSINAVARGQFPHQGA